MSLTIGILAQSTSVNRAGVFNPSIREYRMSQAVEKLAVFIQDEGDEQKFLARNYVTQGMGQLFREGRLRLSGKSDQAVFELTQAMGGDKTHRMIALGRLARDPEPRATAQSSLRATQVASSRR